MITVGAFRGEEEEEEECRETLKVKEDQTQIQKARRAVRGGSSV